MRLSGTDTAGSSYSTQRAEASGGTATGATNQSTSAFYTGYAPVTFEANANYDIFAPNKAIQTTVIGSAIRFANLSSLWIQTVAGKLTATTQFDGLSLVVNSGTITGTITVYGYAK
jgi:hypothetical protein